MAAKTQLSAIGTPGRRHTITAKEPLAAYVPELGDTSPARIFTDTSPARIFTDTAPARIFTDTSPRRQI
jgi:hypothetical protein